ncbi:hypothetical protein [Bradyrhizobium barranii]
MRHIRETLECGMHRAVEIERGMFLLDYCDRAKALGSTDGLADVLREWCSTSTRSGESIWGRSMGKSYNSRLSQAVCDASNEHDGAYRFDADMQMIASKYQVSLDDLKRRVADVLAERAETRERERMAEAPEVLDEIGEALESRGFVHMTNGRDIGMLLDQLDCTKRALDLAVAMLAPHEPGHSCAVSDEFVALAAVSTGDTSAQVMEIIDRPRDPASFNAVPVNLEVVVS